MDTKEYVEHLINHDYWCNYSWQDQICIRALTEHNALWSIYTELKRLRQVTTLQDTWRAGIDEAISLVDKHLQFIPQALENIEKVQVEIDSLEATLSLVRENGESSGQTESDLQHLIYEKKQLIKTFMGETLDASYD